MKPQRTRWGRALLGLGAAALIFATVGDRGIAAGTGGIDPLDVLNLQVRPNAIIVLDSSGSMGETAGGNDVPGDHPDAKLAIAKSVITQVVTANQTKISFGFGRYTQPTGTIGVASGFNPDNTQHNTAFNAFMARTWGYAAKFAAAQTIPDFVLAEYRIPNVGGTAQQFKAREATSNANDTFTAWTSITVPAGTYIGTDLAKALKTALDGNTTLGDTYTVIYRARDPNSGDRDTLTISRSNASRTVQLDFTGTDAAIRDRLGFTASIFIGAGTSGTPYRSNRTSNAGCMLADASIARRLSGSGDNFTEGGSYHYKAWADKYLNGATIFVRNDTSETVCDVQAGTPGLTAPFIKVQYRDASCTGTSGTLFTLPFVGSRTWTPYDRSDTCGGFDSLVDIASCTSNLQITGIEDPYLKPEIRLDASGNPVGYTVDGNYQPTAQPTPYGIRAAGYTPIAESLVDIKSEFDANLWPAYGAQSPSPRTFVIFLTDGDDTCGSETTGDNGIVDTDNERALRAAHRAQLLYAGVGATPDPASRVQTFVIAFGSGVSATRANWIAWGGSGMVLGTRGTGTAQHWDADTSTTTTSEAPTSRAGCATCRDAFVASTAAELTAALQAAIDQGQSSGTFSDQQSVTESIYEYSAVAPCSPACDPLDPQTRYDSSIPVLLQTTFDMPAFSGHLNAFRNEAGSSLLLWDGGQKLYDRVVTNGMGTTQWTFAQLHASATAATIGASSAAIKRRIWTTTRAGVSSLYTGLGALSATDNAAIVASLITPGYQPTEQTTLWPPAATVDPACSTLPCPGGAVDAALGLTTTNYANVAALQAAFGACTASPSGGLAPAACSDANATNAYSYALKEARQILLAFTAGATLDTADGLALRDTSRNLRFRARAWVMGDSTLSSPGIAAPPLEARPSTHQSAYDLYRDGIRAASGSAVNGFAYGFGLRNPDDDQTTASKNDNTLKPVMTVVYHPTNAMLHALRGGPCPGGTCTETGGEELWAFVPYDGLAKLRLLMKGQTRTDHTYMFAAPVRFTDVFVPGTFNTTIGGVSVTGDGVWRTVLLLGRGAGGKYLTALDVTNPGILTQGSLTTRGPIHLWTRGNPDTQNLATGGTKNNDVSNPAGTADYNAYLGMGETWSVPTISFVSAADHITPRKSGGIEFAAYLGSGPSAISTEGSTFFALDALTGDVIDSHDVGDRTGMSYQNALVANAAAFSEEQLRPPVTDAEGNLKPEGIVGHPASSHTTAVYLGDIHGRMWRFKTASSTVNALLFGDVGSNQPIANAGALLFYKGTEASAKPHLFFETGNDNRVTPPPATTPPFKLFGLRDDDLSVDPDATDGVTGPAKVLFAIDLPDNFRGTAQPATAYDDTSPYPNGRVFFIATRFNPAGAEAPFEAPTPPPCVSSFDSILYAVGAESGGAAYDFGGSEYYKISGQRVQAVRVSGGQLVLDTGLGAQNPPPPPAPPAVLPPAPSPDVNVRFGSRMTNNLGAAIPGTMPFMVGSITCR